MRRRVALILLALVSCGGRAPPAESHAPLGGDTVARVGEVALPALLVRAVAEARGLSPREALDRLVDDALAAQGARAAGLDRTASFAWAQESMLARAAVDRVAAASRAYPPSEAEIAEASAARWRELDLPEQVRVIHAIVRRPAGGDAAKEASARAIAAQIADAEAGARDAADFEARANAVPHPGLELLVQRLPAFVSDGRVAEGPEGAMDPVFTRAAFALPAGVTSGVVETPFGWHVLRVLERLPPHVVPAAERPALLAEGIYLHRQRAALEAVLAARRDAARPEVLPDAFAVMSQIVPGADAPP